MTPEEAQDTVANRFDDDWLSSAFARVQQCPGPVAAVGVEFLQFGSNPIDIGLRIDNLQASERLSLFAALVPQFGAALTRWWIDEQAPLGAGATVEGRVATLAYFVQSIAPFDAAPSWIAVWAGHIPDLDSGAHVRSVGRLLAAAFDGGGIESDEVLATLILIAKGKHPIATPTRYALYALANSCRSEAWTTLGELLLGAQRQEGLRFSILDAALGGSAGFQSFVLDLIVQHDLTRSTAVGTMSELLVGIPHDPSNSQQRDEHMMIFAEALRSSEYRRCNVESNNLSTVFLILRAASAVDRIELHQLVATTLARRDANFRAEAIRAIPHFLSPETLPTLVGALQDPDARVAGVALRSLASASCGPTVSLDEPGFCSVISYMKSLPTVARSLPPVGLDPVGPRPTRRMAFGVLLDLIGQRPISAVVPVVEQLDSQSLCNFVYLLTDAERNEPAVRGMLFGLIGHRSKAVCLRASTHLACLSPTSAEVSVVETRLSGKRGAASELVENLVGCLALQDSRSAVLSVRRLWSTTSQQSQQAALDLLVAIGAVKPPVRTALFELDGTSSHPQVKRRLEHLRRSLNESN